MKLISLLGSLIYISRFTEYKCRRGGGGVFFLLFFLFLFFFHGVGLSGACSLCSSLVEMGLTPRLRGLRSQEWRNKVQKH